MAVLDLRLATISDLQYYRQELIEMMDYSVKVNFPYSEIGGVEKYEKLIGYYEQGKANVWLAFDRNDLLGYAQFFKKGNGQVHLNEIAVREGMQGNGIGTRLLKAVEKSAIDSGASYVELFCSETNQKAKELYHKNCYKTVKLLLSKKL